MSNDLTPAEARFVRALCGSGPLGIAPLGLARALGVTPATVGNLSQTVERKGFCTRERYGMRVFLRPTSVAIAFIEANPVELPPGQVPPGSLNSRKTRSPRLPRTR